MTEYPSPVNALLTIGNDGKWAGEWPNYLTLGLGPEHVPDLIRMATDDDLNLADSGSLEVWAPLHAWRALGQLRAEAAVAPLLDVLEGDGDELGDYDLETFPEVLGMIGPEALPALEAALAEGSRDEYARIAIARGICSIAVKHPEARDRCVAILTRALEDFERNEPGLNGFLISNLMELQAEESAPVIERAFAAEAVDEMIVGDWHDVFLAMDLEGPSPPPSRRPRFPFGVPEFRSADLPPVGMIRQFPMTSDRASRNKARRKEQKKARKRNQKRRR